MAYAFDISERFNTPVLVRSTTRISHSKSVVKVNRSRVKPVNRAGFQHDVEKYVMLPVYARLRHPLVEERLVKLAAYAETFPLNQLSMTYPLPQDLLRSFAAQVDKLIVIEELDPFLQENIQAMGIKVTGKEFITRVGELNADIVGEASSAAQLLAETSPRQRLDIALTLPKRPPLLCPGCPHTGLFFVLSSIGQRSKSPKAKSKAVKKPELIITGDIGCYTLGAYPPLNAMDTCACMGASIGQALGMEKAGISDKLVAVIGDSTFLHSGITPLVNAVYNEGQITVIILDNRTTAMTGHQDHPGTGISAQGKETKAVGLEHLVRGMGISDVRVVDAFNIKSIRTAVRNSLDSPELSVIIVRGDCSVRLSKRAEPRAVDTEKCNGCGICLLLGCPAIQSKDGQVYIDAALCAGSACTICQQVCSRQAIVPESKTRVAKSQ
ncbi:hypothetical protein ES703_103804 [subsurface metagenome]